MRKLTTEEFIQKAKDVHGDKYDYSQSIYINQKTKVDIICPEHGIFKQTPDGHLRGQGCPKCKANKTSSRCRKSYDEFVRDARNVHGDKYDYSKFNYVNSITKGIIICPKHGEFEQTPPNHLSGKGCPECAKERISEKNRLTTEYVIQMAKNIHPEYDYSNSVYSKTSEDFNFICPKHGEVKLRASSLLYSHCGCPLCHKSIGENKVKKYLDSNNILYKEQYKIRTNENIRVSGYSYADFYLPDYNVIIEYNGIQHYKSVNRFGGEDSLIDQQRRDSYVKWFCYLNGLYFLEISYQDENIEEIISKFLENPIEVCPEKWIDEAVYIQNKENNVKSDKEFVIIPKEYFYKLI